MCSFFFGKIIAFVIFELTKNNMKKLKPLSNLFTTVCSLALLLMLSITFSASAQQKVVGGVDVDIKDYPWQIALTSSPTGSGFCGGSIIGDSWVLTAAHCVNGDNPSGLFIRAGASASFASGGDSYSVNQIIVHPSYSGNSFDFALVEINGEFNYNSNVQKIDLIDANEIAAGSQAGGIMATITGWGSTSSGGSLASVLQMVEAPIVENDVACGSASDTNGNAGQYPCTSLDESMICAGDLIDGGEDACQGDSGGPLVVRSSDNSKWILIGATSWGYGCADVLYPGVWSKVSHVLDWIDSNAETNSENGCMDATACNYDPEAIYDNGSCAELDECGDCGGNGPAAGYDCDGNCTTGETLVITLTDSYGDGWNGGVLTVNGISTTLSSGSESVETLCYDSTEGCVNVSSGGGSWESEMSWSIADADGNVLLFGGAPYEGAFGGEGCGPVFGCMDSLALNFNSEATSDDNSCMYPVEGCMDTLALNYNENAVVDNGSCTYPIDCSDATAYNVMMYDSYGDGWNGNVFSVSSNGQEVFSSTIEGFESEGSADFCLNDGCYLITVDGGSYPTEVSWSLISEEGELLLSGSAPAEESLAVNFDGECGPIYGCMDSLALNFNSEATSDDNSCMYPLEGCTDTLALNYDEYAVVDNGSCNYSIDCAGLTPVVIEVGGGSWADEVSWSLNDFTGVTGSTQVCLEDGCQLFNLYDSFGDGWNGNTVTILSGNDVLLTGTLETGSESVLSFALNFEGECGPVYGCMDSLALNYDPTATSNDNSCTYPVSGCMDSLASNYNPDAVEEDGSCVYPIDCDGLTAVVIEVGGGFYDSEISWELNGLEGVTGSTEYCLDAGCYSFNMLDSYGDGWNGATASITTATGELLFSGTLEVGSSETVLFSFNSDCGYVSGCTDANALNYNPEATIEDGSCTYDSSCDAYMVMMQMDDSFGDGWNGAAYEISSDGALIASGTLLEGSLGVDDLCLDAACYTISVAEGTYPTEVSWTLTLMYDDIMEIIASGTTGDVDFGLNSEDCTDEQVYGCTDMDAINYNQLAVADDGSCEYETECNGYVASLNVSSVSFGTEHDWIITDANGTELYAGGQYANNTENITDLCLENDADYSITLSDSYGDGWNGGTFTITTTDCELAAGGLENGQQIVFDFTTSCDDTNSGTDVPWEILVTGSNHTIVIPEDAAFDLDGIAIEEGDALGVFYTDSNGDSQCGGFAAWTGSTNSIAAQGDDTTTDEIDGFTSDASFVWMVWDASEGVAYMTNAEYSSDMPNQGAYTTNGISALASLTAVESVSDQTMDMPFGWSIFSTYLSFETMDLATILSSIFDQIIICKNNAGDAYLPEWGFNGIGDVEVGQGYQIKLLNDINITAEGQYMAPEDNPIDLTAGWNMIGYLRLEPADAAAVLFDINATNNLVIAKDFNGQAYLPEWNFNGIGDLVSGQGYQLKLNNDDVLTYLSNEESYRMSSIAVTNNSPSHFEKVTLTDNNMTIVIEDTSWDILPEDGAEIAAYDNAGNLVGSAKYTSPVSVLTLWGDDALTATKDGLETAEVSSFKVWSNNQTTSFEITKWTEGSSSYTANAINVASGITSTSSTDILLSERVLLKVINVLGQEVTFQDAFKGEILFNVYNDGTVDKIVK